MSAALNNIDENRKNQIKSRVIEVRYTDFEEERRLCEELLTLSEEQGDNEGLAFAHTYLGDYYLSVNNSTQTEIHLLTARKLIEPIDPENGHTQLSMRLYSLLGLYYENESDEQTSVQYYLMAIEAAKRLGDIISKCIVLNNLAYVFQRHHSYTQALKYYKQAYELQKELPEFQVRIVLLSNMMETYLVMGRFEDAKRCLKECEEAGQGDAEDEENKSIFLVRNRCYYYAVTGDHKKAVYWAKYFLDMGENMETNRLSSFQHYLLMFQSMFQIGNQEYASVYLELMEKYGQEGGLGQQQLLEDKRVHYILRFAPKGSRGEAFRNYYKKTQAFKQQVNHNIASAMKGEIHLEEVMNQKEDLKSRQINLQRQANMDELTGIYNRRYMERNLREMAENRMAESQGAIMLDVDYFKEYNDHYGHIEGDRVLKIIGDCLRENMREGIQPCRYGGDEFTCLCEGISDRDVEDYIRSIREDLRQHNIPHQYSRCSENITLSIGYVNERKNTGVEPHTLVQLADQALYQSKMSGRNSYTRKQVGVSDG